MGRCKTCRHWLNGECTFVENMAAEEPARRFEIVVVVNDDHGLTSRLMTGPDFGCVHHEGCPVCDNFGCSPVQKHTYSNGCILNQQG